MRVLVTGGTGLLGTKVVELAQRRGLETFSAARRPPAPEAPPAPFMPLDLTNRASVQAAFERVRPNLVIHTAAMADVDACEREPELAWAVNAEGTTYVAEACRVHDARLVYVSTDYVFDGTAGPYREEDATNPLNVYAETKLAGERAVAMLPNAITARTAVLYGWAPGIRSNLVLWLLDRLARGEPAPAATDQAGSPTLADNLAEMLIALAVGRQTGVYHVAGATMTDRYRFCRLAAEVFGYDPDLIRPIRSAEISRPARRPANVALVIDKLRRDVPEARPLAAREALEVLRGQLTGRLPRPRLPDGDR